MLAGDKEERRQDVGAGGLEGASSERAQLRLTYLNPDRAKDKTITESISAKSLGDAMCNWPI